MTAIIEFFTGLYDIIKTIIDFIISFFEDIVYVIKTIGEFIGKAPTLFGFLPPAVLAIFLVGLSIVVIYKVIGRD